MSKRLNIILTILAAMLVLSCGKLEEGRAIEESFRSASHDSALQGWWASREVEEYYYFDCGSAKYIIVYQNPESATVDKVDTDLYWKTSSGTLYLYSKQQFSKDLSFRYIYKVESDGTSTLLLRNGSPWLEKL